MRIGEVSLILLLLLPPAGVLPLLLPLLVADDNRARIVDRIPASNAISRRETRLPHDSCATYQHPQAPGQLAVVASKVEHKAVSKVAPDCEVCPTPSARPGIAQGTVASARIPTGVTCWYLLYLPVQIGAYELAVDWQCWRDDNIRCDSGHALGGVVCPLPSASLLRRLQFAVVARAVFARCWASRLGLGKRKTKKGPPDNRRPVPLLVLLGKAAYCRAHWCELQKGARRLVQVAILHHFIKNHSDQ